MLRLALALTLALTAAVARALAAAVAGALAAAVAWARLVRVRARGSVVCCFVFHRAPPSVFVRLGFCKCVAVAPGQISRPQQILTTLTFSARGRRWCHRRQTHPVISLDPLGFAPRPPLAGV